MTQLTATPGHLLQAASLQCHSQQEAALKHDSAASKAAQAGDKTSWAAVDEWQDAQRKDAQQQSQRQHAALSDAGSAFERSPDLCKVQLRVAKNSDDDTDSHICLLVTVTEEESHIGGAESDAAASATELRQHLLSIEAEAAATVNSAAEEMAAAIGKAAAKQRNLCEEHLEKVWTQGGLSLRQ